MRSFKGYLRYFVLLLTLCMTVPLFSSSTGEEPGATPGQMMTVRVSWNRDMPTVQSVTVGPGRWSAPCRQVESESFENGGGSLGERFSRLVLRDASGARLFEKLFGYPTALTVPMRQPGDTGGRDVDVIFLEEGEVVLVVPYFPGARSLEIFPPGGTAPVSRINLDGILVPEAVSAVPEPGVAANGGEWLDILVIASGFDDSNIRVFNERASQLKDFLLAVEPFKSYAQAVNVHIYPNLADTGCYTGCGGINRLLCCHGEKVINAALASGYPFDEIVVLHNTETYSGGGYRENLDAYKTNSYSTYAMSYIGSRFKEVVLHELGHSFGNLCDEYSYSSEGYSYNTCVNCRAQCSDWASLSSACQLGCSSESDYYRPENSIMLTLSILTFNNVSIYASYLPDGLDRRLAFFAGEERLIYVPVRAERLKERAWLLVRAYGAVDIIMDDPEAYGIDKFVIYRKARDGNYEARGEVTPAQFEEGHCTYNDMYLEDGTVYTYRIEALNGNGEVIGRSDEIGNI